jgi:hypothetical protein
MRVYSVKTNSQSSVPTPFEMEGGDGKRKWREEKERRKATRGSREEKGTEEKVGSANQIAGSATILDSSLRT